MGRMNLNFHQHKIPKPKTQLLIKETAAIHPLQSQNLPHFTSSPNHRKETEAFHHLPSQRKSQPISNPPRNQQHAIRQPNASRYPIVRSVRPRMARQVDRHQQHNACRQRDGQEHRHEEIPGRCAQREVVAEDEKDDDGDHQEGQEGEYFGRDGGGRGGGGRGWDREIHVSTCWYLLTIEVCEFVVPFVMGLERWKVEIVVRVVLEGTIPSRRNDDAAAVAEVSRGPVRGYAHGSPCSSSIANTFCSISHIYKYEESW
jgi:hypothetical protein